MRNKATYLLTAIASVLLMSSALYLPSRDKYFEIVKNLEIFTNVYQILNEQYVDELDPGKLMKVAIDAMTQSLDPYTNYYSESQIESYRITDDERYAGYGSEFQEVDGQFYFTEVEEGGSADKAGIAIGDQLLAVNTESVAGKNKEEIELFMRGFPGSSLKVDVVKLNGEKKTIEIDRNRSTTKNVPYYGFVGDGIGYAKLTKFSKQAGLNIERAIKDLMIQDKEMKGFILDLRYNGGGLLREAIRLSNVFIPNDKEIVTTKGKLKAEDQVFKTKSNPLTLDMPLIVLINNRSASASEIVSGTIQDYDRGVIMGQRSYGKGLVQNRKDVGYNSNMKLTTSRYYIPSGRLIQAVKYENGEPVDIPDAQRSTFYTANGRPVLDGGGITPDVKLEANKKPEILQTMMDSFYIFKYANQYVQSMDSIQNTDFTFDDFDDFINFLKADGFHYETRLEKELLKMQKIEADHPIGLGNDFETLMVKIKSEKADDLGEYKEDITHSIESELISRFLYENGETEHNLNNDPEIKEAVNLLLDSKRYNQILQN